MEESRYLEAVLNSSPREKTEREIYETEIGEPWSEAYTYIPKNQFWIYTDQTVEFSAEFDKFIYDIVIK